MIRAAIFPGRYVQGRDAIRQIADFIKPFGKSVLLLSDRNVRSFVEPSVKTSLEAAGIPMQSAEFSGECSWNEIGRIVDMAKASNAEVIIGAGGGKTIDTAKSAAHKAGCRSVIVPTTASSDAPTSALAVIYTEKGEFQEYFFLPKNPDMVLMDLTIIANAPLRSLVSGMGDALATWFEADTCAHSGASAMSGGLQTSAGLALARLCYESLLEYGPSAVLAVSEKVITPAFEKIVEANTLLSGIGFESGGLAAAHAIHNGLTELPETHKYLHGEKVAFGTLTQLVLENRSNEELAEVLGFMSSVGLPGTLEEIGLPDVSRDKLRMAAEAATKPGETIHNEPFPVSVDDLIDAMIAADALARTF
ncbi:MAG TPA: glycerol dehydrogenase [Armatimonadota bacterium]|jgi:glycerol dehydrogenase